MQEDQHEQEAVFDLVLIAQSLFSLIGEVRWNFGSSAIPVSYILVPIEVQSYEMKDNNHGLCNHHGEEANWIASTTKAVTTFKSGKMVGQVVEFDAERPLPSLIPMIV